MSLLVSMTDLDGVRAAGRCGLRAGAESPTVSGAVRAGGAACARSSSTRSAAPGRNAHRRGVQAAADGLGDLADRDAVLGRREQLRAGRGFLQRQWVEGGDNVQGVAAGQWLAPRSTVCPPSMSVKIIPCISRRGRRLAYARAGGIGYAERTAHRDGRGGPDGAGDARPEQVPPTRPASLDRCRRGRCVILVAGIVFAVLHPPVLTSTAAVLLAPQLQSAQAATSNGAPDPYTATQEVIADSNPVLAAALPAVHPAMSLAELRGDVRIGSPNSLLITVTAKGRVAADAEATANAVASSYIGYVNSAGNPAGHKAVMLELGPAPPEGRCRFGC